MNGIVTIRPRRLGSQGALEPTGEPLVTAQARVTPAPGGVVVELPSEMIARGLPQDMRYAEIEFTERGTTSRDTFRLEEGESFAPSTGRTRLLFTFFKP